MKTSHDEHKKLKRSLGSMLIKFDNLTMTARKRRSGCSFSVRIISSISSRPSLFQAQNLRIKSILVTDLNKN